MRKVLTVFLLLVGLLTLTASIASADGKPMLTLTSGGGFRR